jgi:hypothetical protein
MSMALANVETIKAIGENLPNCTDLALEDARPHVIGAHQRAQGR